LRDSIISALIFDHDLDLNWPNKVMVTTHEMTVVTSLESSNRSENLMSETVR
jgi:hypothetical protein